MNFDDLQLDRENQFGIPLFEQISQWIIDNIEAGFLKQGDKLPTEREIAKRFNVARGTVKSALKSLENDQIIQTIQGSGSYVTGGSNIVEFQQKKEALEIIELTLHKLRNLNLTEPEILNLIHQSLNSKLNNPTLSIAIIDNNVEAMMDLKNQLAHLPDISLSVLILESITISLDPENLLDQFDLIITSSSCYPEITALLPNLKDRLIEAVISSSQRTLVKISSLPKTARIGIICRTNVFLSTVMETLISFQFDPKNILSFFEMEYTTSTYFPGGIDALISFQDAHIFTRPDFVPRNDEFVAKGGRLIKFVSHFEKGSLIYIENRINELLKQKNF